MDEAPPESLDRRPARAGVAVAALAVVALLVWAGSLVAGGFTPDGTQPVVTHAIQSPGLCSTCHGGFQVAAHTEPWDTWAGSMMANASRDPLFWAALDVANNDIPGVGDFCLRCHVPTGWLAGRSEPPLGSADGCDLVGNLDSDAADFAGVSCHLCHRMMVNPAPPPGEAGVYYENGKYWIDDGDCPGPGSGPCRRGPYDYPGGVPDPPPHEWAFSQYHLDSDICGNCHNVTSPAQTLIVDGVDSGIPFPIERTFVEWQQSDFATPGPDFVRCQGCHMPVATTSPVFACSFKQNDRTGDLPIHQFAGGNAWIPQVLAGEYPSLGRAASFAATRAWALDMLQNQSATVELTAPAETLGNVAATVRVTNLTGHKLPTGYGEGRRMWLALEARDDLGALVWQSGAYDVATGVLSEDAQLKVYHREAGIWNRNGTNACDVDDGGGNPIFHFVLGDCVRTDNRIPPQGFTGGTDPETRPVGYVYPETSPGSGELVHHDVTSYAIPVPPGTAMPLTVTARLYYQTASRDYVEFLRDQAVDNAFPDDCIPRSTGTPAMSRGEILHDMWTRYGRAAPVEMGVDVAVVAAGIFGDGFESGNVSAWSGHVP